MSVFVPVSHCFDYCGFVVLPEVWEVRPPALPFPPQDYFGNSGSSLVPCRFWMIYSSSVKNVS